VRSRTGRPPEGAARHHDVVNEVVTLVQRELSSRRVALRLELAPGLPAVMGDRVQLQQVIINLVMRH